MDPIAALQALGGAARWTSLITAGCTDGQLRAAVRRGLIVRSGRAFALPSAGAGIVTAARLRGTLCCSSAALEQGLDVLVKPAKPHVCVPRNQSNGDDGAIVHRWGRREMSVAPVTDLAVDVLRCLPALEALAIIDSGLRLGRTTQEAVRKKLRGPGSVRQRNILSLTDGRAGSPIETVARVALRAAGLQVRCQVFIADVGRVDLLIDGWLVVEIDGYAYHSSRDQFRADRRRANRLVQQGYSLLRFSYEDVMSRPDRLVAIVCYVHRRGQGR